MPAVVLIGAAFVLAAAPMLADAGGATGLGWIDSVSRIGVIGILALALYGLQKRWWVPGWAYRELNQRHEALRARYDEAVEIALTSSRGVQRSASVLDDALAEVLRRQADADPDRR